MRVLGLDVETTGLDTQKDRVIEIGWVIWDTDTKQPLRIKGACLRDLSYPIISQEITQITGITQDMHDEFSVSPEPVYEMLDRECIEHCVSYIVAHNGNAFDRPILMAELDRYGVLAHTLRQTPWLDTKVDVPYPEHFDSRRLKHLALEHGFINPFPHRAVTDVLSMLKVLSHYNIDEVVSQSKLPNIVVRAVVSFDDKEQAKARKYSWEKIGDKTYPKFWVKQIKADKLEEEIKMAPFKVVVLTEK